jgi:hypothetical protein
LWASTQIDDEIKKTLGLRDDQYVNQFPFEACIVMKHHLAKTMQQVSLVKLQMQFKGNEYVVQCFLRRPTSVLKGIFIDLFSLHRPMEHLHGFKRLMIWRARWQLLLVTTLLEKKREETTFGL